MTAPLIFNTSLAGVADTTAPTLFAGATSVVSTTAWTGVITTDEGNGVLYTLGNQSASASAAAVKAGGTMLAVASAGQKSLSFTGLTPDTSGYYAPHHARGRGGQSERSDDHRPLRHARRRRGHRHRIADHPAPG
jgi:hypothetical protein